jgi:hypothetical protein
MKSTKKSSEAIKPLISPKRAYARPSDMKVLIYFGDPMSRKIKADATNGNYQGQQTSYNQACDQKSLERSLLVVFFSCTNSLRTVFISLSNASMISLTSGN